MDLVANRECGECYACCHHIPIDQNDIVKLPNVDCEHLMAGGGCEIYKKRPITCSDWHCAWRLIPDLKDHWRPDISGVIIDFSTKATPEEFPDKMAIVLKVIDKEKFLNNPELTLYIVRIVNRNLAVFLSYGAKKGFSAISMLLNYILQPAIKEKDYKEVSQKIKSALQECENSPGNILKIKDGHIISTKPN